MPGGMGPPGDRMRVVIGDLLWVRTETGKEASICIEADSLLKLFREVVGGGCFVGCLILYGRMRSRFLMRFRLSVVFYPDFRALCVVFLGVGLSRTPLSLQSSVRGCCKRRTWSDLIQEQSLSRRLGFRY